jgi:hypothetical protein
VGLIFGCLKLFCSAEEFYGIIDPSILFNGPESALPSILLQLAV